MLAHFSRVWLWNPMDCSLTGSSVHEILQVRILEWVAISFSRGSSRPRDQTLTFYIYGIGRQVLYHKCHLVALSLKHRGGVELESGEPVRVTMWVQTADHTLSWLLEADLVPSSSQGTDLAFGPYLACCSSPWLQSEPEESVLPTWIFLQSLAVIPRFSDLWAALHTCQNSGRKLLSRCWNLGSQSANTERFFPILLLPNCLKIVLETFLTFCSSRVSSHWISTRYLFHAFNTFFPEFR